MPLSRSLARLAGFLLNTNDREIAGRTLKEKITKLKNTAPQQSKTTLEALLALSE